MVRPLHEMAATSVGPYVRPRILSVTVIARARPSLTVHRRLRLPRWSFTQSGKVDIKDMAPPFTKRVIVAGPGPP